MSDTLLRSNLIRLASAHPEFRKDILPLLSISKTASETPVYTVMSDVIDASLKLMKERGLKTSDLDKGGFRKLLAEGFDTVPHGAFNSFEELSKAHSKHLDEMEEQADQLHKTAAPVSPKGSRSPFEVLTAKALLPVLHRAEGFVQKVICETNKHAIHISMYVPDAKSVATSQASGDPSAFDAAFFDNIDAVAIEAALLMFFGHEVHVILGMGSSANAAVYCVDVIFIR